MFEMLHIIVLWSHVT